MNDFQLALSIGIPSLLVILSWIHNNIRLSRLVSSLDTANRRVDETNRRIDETNRRFDDLIRGINADMSSLRDSIHRDMIGLHERLATVEARQPS